MSFFSFKSWEQTHRLKTVVTAHYKSYDVKLYRVWKCQKEAHLCSLCTTSVEWPLTTHMGHTNSPSSALLAFSTV